MALKAFDVFGEITLKGAQQVQKGLKTSAAEAGKAEGKMGFLGKAGTLAGIGLAAAAVAAVKFGIDAVKAAAAAEVRQKRLEVVVRNTGVAYDDYAASIKSTIEEQKRLSAFGGGELKDTLSTLVRMTGNVGEANRMLGQTTDFARATGMDLGTSAKLLGKVYNGNTSILKRYGIQVREGATSTEALAQIQEMAAGAGEAYSKTLTGQSEVLANRWAATQTNIGSKAIPVLSSYTGALEALTRSGLSWEQRLKLIDEVQADFLISSSKWKTVAQAKASLDYKVATAEQKRLIVTKLNKAATEGDTSSILANVGALEEQLAAAKEETNAKYESEDAAKDC